MVRLEESKQPCLLRRSLLACQETEPFACSCLIAIAIGIYLKADLPNSIIKGVAIINLPAASLFSERPFLLYKPSLELN